MRELWVRALTGAIYVAITLGAAWAGPFTTVLLFLPVCIIAMREMHLLYWGEDGPPIVWSMLTGATTFITVAMGAFDDGWHMGYTTAVGFLLVLVTITWSLLRGEHEPARALGGTLTGLLLVAVPFGSLAFFFAYGPWMFIAFMVLLWTNDTGAYLVGRSIGRTRLLPSVSPRKTVEGLLGGVALTALAAWLFARTNSTLAMQEWITLGLIVSITATLGDLLESAFKRARGVKDSGSVLPGHGGILDRFDGFLLAVPAALLYLRLVH